MTQALCVEDGSLPWGLTVQNAYTELRKGSKNVIMVVRNSMAYPQTLKKKTPVVRVVEVTWVPETLVQTGLMGAMGELEDNGHQIPRLTVKKAKRSFLRNWIWVGWSHGNPSWRLLPGLSWLSTMTSSHWNPANLAAPIQPNMSLKFLMIPYSRNDLGRYLCPSRGGL